MKSQQLTTTKLKRSLGLGALLVYGVGDILGAGIYALLGKVAGVSGYYTWLAFLIAFVVAILTGLSYMELTARFPKSSGAAHYVSQAFRSPTMPLLVGWFVAIASIVSLSAAARAFSGYFQEIVALPDWILIVIFLATLSAINFRGIAESSFANIVCTVVELSGLLLILGFGLWNLSDAPTLKTIGDDGLEWGVFAGASLAFYAFIGFEDLANVAEEAKNPTRDLPIAIIGSLLFASCIYVGVAYVATSFMDPQSLAKSSAPLVAVAKNVGTPISGIIFTTIALFAVANTALLNAITGSRLIFGLADQGLLPKGLARTNSKTKTPVVAILVVFFVALTLSVLGSIEILAGATSLLLLLTFCLVHTALLKLPKEPHKGIKLPLVFPWLGITSSVVLIALLPWKHQLLGTGLVVLGLILVQVYLRTQNGGPLSRPAKKK